MKLCWSALQHYQDFKGKFSKKSLTFIFTYKVTFYIFDMNKVINFPRRMGADVKGREGVLRLHILTCFVGRERRQWNLLAKILWGGGGMFYNTLLYSDSFARFQFSAFLGALLGDKLSALCFCAVCVQDLVTLSISVVDPDPDLYWIRIQELPGSGFGIRIWIHTCKFRIKWRQKMSD